MSFKMPRQVSLLDTVILSIFAEEARKQASGKRSEELPAVAITQREILERLKARGVNICLRTLKYHIKMLKERGFLTVERRYTRVWDEEQEKYVPRQLPGLYRLTRRALEASIRLFQAAVSIFRAAGLILSPSRIDSQTLRRFQEKASVYFSREKVRTTILGIFGAAQSLYASHPRIPAYIWKSSSQSFLNETVPIEHRFF